MPVHGWQWNAEGHNVCIPRASSEPGAGCAPIPWSNATSRCTSGTTNTAATPTLPDIFGDF